MPAIVFVCLGNICRSPMAEAVMRQLLLDAGRDDVQVESAGTGSWHVGEGADPRTLAELATRGIEMDHRAQQFTYGDFERFDLVVVMDDDNERVARSLAPSEEAAARVVRLRSFDPEVAGAPEVPDPYYGGPQGFTLLYEMVERSCRGLLDHIDATW